MSLKVLSPEYISGFVDGEGSFSVSVSKHKTLKRKLEVRPEFEIELRADDTEIIERIQKSLDCGKIYQLNYEKYGWYPHVKYKVSSIKALTEKIIPFFDRHPLQAKKKKVYQIFREIVLMAQNKEHLSGEGFDKIWKLREEIRKYGKKHRLETARIRENRSFGGVRQKI